MPPKGTLLAEPYDPDAFDGDGDGIVQEGTAWERPAGTRIILADGRQLERGRVSDLRPGGIRIVDSNGREVQYKPKYQGDIEAPITTGTGGGSPLADFGAGTLREAGLPSVRQTVQAQMAPQPGFVQPDLSGAVPGGGGASIVFGQPGPIAPPPGLPEWEDPMDIIDPKAFGRGYWDFEAMEPFELEYEIHEDVMGGWEQWIACREIRRAAYELVGKDPEEPGPEDAAVASEMSPSGYTGVANSEGWIQNSAKWLMAKLAVGVRRGPAEEDMTDDDPKLVRAMALRTTQIEEDFFDRMVPGEVVDIPLISTARNHNVGGKSALEGFGTDVLLEFEAGTVSYRAGAWGPRYTDSDEDSTIERISDILDDFEVQLDSELSADDLDPDDREAFERDSDFIEEVRTMLKDYEKIDKAERDELDAKRAEIIDTLEQMGIIQSATPYESPDYKFNDGDPLRWAGESINSETDADYYYDAMDQAEYGNSENTTSEEITGGRFEVVSVERGTESNPAAKPFVSKVRLRQVGVFDPTYPGKLINIGGASEMVEVKALYDFR
jgi:hypothetical protein